MTLQITKVETPKSKYAVKCPYTMEPEGLTIHETGNVATAMAEISYMLGNERETSYHFAIDDERAVQGLPLNRNGWHAGDGGSGFGNRKTIGLEHCFNWTGGRTTRNHAVFEEKYQKAIKNGIELAAQLFVMYPKWGVPESGKNIWRHYDHSKKNCPQRMIEENYWTVYVHLVKVRFLELIDKPIVAGEKVVAKKPVPAKPIVKPVVKEGGILNMNGTFVAKEQILVRDSPSTGAKHIATYFPGEEVKYDRAHFVNNYVWLEYRRGNGGKGYIPIAPLSEIWGQLK